METALSSIPCRSPELEQRPWHSDKNLQSQLAAEKVSHFRPCGPLIVLLSETLIEEMLLWWLLAWQSLFVNFIAHMVDLQCCFLLLLYSRPPHEYLLRSNLLWGWMTPEKVLGGFAPTLHPEVPRLIPVPYLHSSWSSLSLPCCLPPYTFLYMYFLKYKRVESLYRLGQGMVCIHKSEVSFNCSVISFL